MHRLEVGIVFTVTGTGRETESADSATGNIGKDVTVLVRQHYYVQCLWCRDKASGQIIDEKFLITQALVCTHSLLYYCSETTVGARHDRILCTQGYAPRIPACLSAQGQFTGGNRHPTHLLIGADAQGIGSLFGYRWSLPP